MTFSPAGPGHVGSFSSRQLRVVGVPLTRITFEAPVLRWEIVGDESTSTFEGLLRGDALSGTFRDGSASGTFAFTRGATTGEPLREDEITFANGPVVLSGTIVFPPGLGPFPGMVFLHGSGAEGRWASRYLAHELARRGVASLIYDKRGVGRSTGDWRAAGFADLVGDAVAAVEALRSQVHVAPDRVGIYGHSQGGTIVPWVASEDRHVAFVVGAAAGGVSMAEMETFSVENSLNVGALESVDRELARQYVRTLVATAYAGEPRSALDMAWEKVRGRAWAFAPPPETDPYWSFSRRIATYDPVEYWRRVAVPALLLYGERDERVPPRRSAARIAEAYLGAHGPRLDVIFYPEAGHDYRVRTDSSRHFAWPETAPGYPENMIDWVLRVAPVRSTPGANNR
jgi:pimeloyl-ACP methyl ester carboxylesterase